MREPKGFPRRALTEDEAGAVEAMLARTKNLVLAAGLRGLDADVVAEELVEDWLPGFLSGRACHPPTLLDARSAAAHFRRSESRIHDREASTGSSRSADQDPLRALVRRDDRIAIRAAIRNATSSLCNQDRRAMALRLAGLSLEDIARSLGGSASKWSRREREFMVRLRQAFTSAHLARQAVSGLLVDGLRDALEPPTPPVSE